MLVVSSTDGFCSVIKFLHDELGTIYSDEEADLEPLMALDESALDDEESMEQEDSDDDLVPVSKDGIPLNKVCISFSIKKCLPKIL